MQLVDILKIEQQLEEINDSLKKIKELLEKMNGKPASAGDNQNKKSN